MSAIKDKTDADLKDILAIIASLENKDKIKNTSAGHKEKKERLEREHKRDAEFAQNLQDEEYALKLSMREQREAQDRALSLKMLAEEDAAYAIRISGSKTLPAGFTSKASSPKILHNGAGAGHPPSEVGQPPSAVRHPQSAAVHSPSAVLLFSVERKHTTESDALIALTLHHEFLEERSRAVRIKEDRNFALLLQNLGNESGDCEADAGLASYLQGLEYAGGLQDSEAELMKFANRKKLLAQLSTAEKSKIEADLQNILQSPAIVGDCPKPPSPVKGTADTAGAGAPFGAVSLPGGAPVSDRADAHRFTRSFIRAGAPVLTAIDDKFKLSDPNLSPDQVLKEVLAFVESIPKKYIKPEVVGLIQNTINLIAINRANNEKLAAEGKLASDQVNVEYGETAVNIPQFLSRSWTLATRLGQVHMGIITSCLGDNIADGGGCMAGLIARLYAVYARMVAQELGVELRAVNVPKPAS